MCYTFCNTLEEEVKLFKMTNLDVNDEVIQILSSETHVLQSIASRKRPAETSLEGATTKVVKRIHHSEYDEESSASEANGSSDEGLGSPEKKSTESQSRMKYLECRLRELERERNDSVVQTVRLKADKERLRSRVNEEASNADERGKAWIKTLRQEVELKYEDKHKKQQIDYDNKVEDLKNRNQEKIDKLRKKHTELVAEKVDEYKKKMVEMKAKKDEKDAKAESARAEKDLKSEFQKKEKQIKAHHAEEVKSLKLEHSKVIKEKDSALKDEEKKIATLQNTIEKSEEDLKKLTQESQEWQSQKTKLKADLTQTTQKYFDVFRAFHMSVDEVKRLQTEIAEVKAEREAKSIEDGKKWQLQHNKAEKYAADFVAQQRANSVLRDGLASKDKKIEDLQVELAAAQERIEHLKDKVEEVEYPGGDTENAEPLGDWSAPEVAER